MVHITVVQVAVHVAEQECKALSRPMLSDPGTGCPDNAATTKH